MGCLKLDILEENYSPLKVVRDDLKTTVEGCTGAYLFGFNGMEKDDEIYGEGNAYDFGARMYDGRTGRWFSIDPLAEKYTHLSTYCFVANSPIIWIDTDGEKIRGVKYNSSTGQYQYSKAALKRGTDTYINARITTKNGEEAIQKMISAKQRFKLVVTPYTIVDPLEDDGSGITKYATIGGLTIPKKWIIISTSKDNTESLLSQGAMDDVIRLRYINQNGNLKKIKILRSQLSKVYNDPEQAKKYEKYMNLGIEELDNLVEQGILTEQDAYKIKYNNAIVDSGFEEWISKPENSSRSVEEVIHYTGAHEEIHLFQFKWYNEDTYNIELPAFTAGKNAGVDYKSCYGNEPTIIDDNAGFPNPENEIIIK